MDLDGRRVVRVTGGDPSLNDGGETPIVIDGVMLPRRGKGAHRPALKFCGLKCRAKRSNRGFLLAITGIIASKTQFRAKFNAASVTRPDPHSRSRETITQ